MKSTRVNFSRNPSESFNLPNLKKYAKFICIFHDFDTLTNIAENGCSREKVIYSTTNGKQEEKFFIHVYI